MFCFAQSRPGHRQRERRERRAVRLRERPGPQSLSLTGEGGRAWQEAILAMSKIETRQAT